MIVTRILGVLSIAAVLALGGSAGAQAPAPVPPAAAPAAAPAKPGAQVPAVPDRRTMLMLTRGTFLALDQANKTGNYTVFRDLGGPGFQQQNTAARLAVMFVGLRQTGTDLAEVAVIEPLFNPAPAMGADGILALDGTIALAKAPIKFQTRYRKFGNYWRLAGISLAPVTPAGAAKPPVAAPARPAAAPARPPVAAPEQ